MDLGEQCCAHRHPSLADPVMVADLSLPVALRTLPLCQRPESGTPPASRSQYCIAKSRQRVDSIAGLHHP